MKYLRRGKPNNSTADNGPSDADGIENNLEKQKNDVADLRTLVANNRNMETIKSKLISTMQYRAILLDNEEIDLKREFPFFFVSAELVRFPHFSIHESI